MKPKESQTDWDRWVYDAARFAQAFAEERNLETKMHGKAGHQATDLAAREIKRIAGKR